LATEPQRGPDKLERRGNESEDPEATVQTGFLVSAVRQKPIIWSRVGSVSCFKFYDEARMAESEASGVDETCREAASPGGNSPDAMPLAIICSKIAAMRSCAAA